MTVKKFIALTSAALAAVALTASAQVDVDVVSAYVFRGGTINDEVNVQPGFGTEAFGGAVSVGTWGNYNTDTSEFDEIDYFFGIPLPTGSEDFSAEIGYTEYVYNAGEADREPYLALGFGDVSFLVAYGIDGAIDELLYLELGYSTSVDVVNNIGAEFSAALGYIDPKEGDSGFSHLTLGLTFDIAIPETDYSVAVGVTYIVETDDKVQEIDEDTYFTIGTSL
jgi:hypothetical protein